MRNIPRVLLLSLLVVLLISTNGTSANAQFSDGVQNDKNIHLLSSTNDGVTFEVNLSSDQLIEEIIEIEGKNFVNLTIPGESQTSQEGEPALPFFIENLAVPFGVEFEVSVFPGKKLIKVLAYPVLPVRTQVVDWGEYETREINTYPSTLSYKTVLNKDVYGMDQAFPGTLAEIANDGIFRTQRILGVGIYPVQYIPKTGELIIFETLKVTVKFIGMWSTPTESFSSDSFVFEDLMQGNLLNYESATKWRQEPSELNLQSNDMGFIWTPPDPGWRVQVQEEGFYKINYDELNSAGLPVDTLNPQTLQLFYQGDEVAIQVQGEGDGSFDTNDYILFYGQKIDSKYTADNVYWLTFGKTTEVLRFQTRDVTPGTAETPLFYNAKYHIEENLNYLNIAPGPEDFERWLWDYVYAKNSEPETVSYAFTLSNPYPSPATLEVSLLGFTSHTINPDHHVKVYIGDSFVGEVYWDGRSWNMIDLPIEGNLLVNGENTITIECSNDTGVTYDVVYIDWIGLGFSKYFIALDNQLEFSYEEAGTWKFQIEGFTSNDINVYDLTNPNTIEQLTGFSINSKESGYSVEFEDDVSESKKYWAMTDARMMTVQEIEQDIPSNIQSSINGAEYLIITHGDFSSQAQTLKSFRDGQGLVSDWVDVQDIYDEFNYGIVDVVAIRNFLAHTIENWDIYPSYVVLLGDGHYNPKGYNPGLYDIWQKSYIPPYLAPVDPTILETAADNRYVTLVGDDILPDMMLGRLPVNNIDEANALVEKIITYETNSPTGEWRNQIMAVTDNPDNAGNFYLISDNLLDCCLPEPFIAEKVYFQNTHLIKDATRLAIQDGINAGKLIVNYIGHATTPQWASEGLFKVADIGNLINGDKMPIMLPMTCMDGYFIYPGSSNQGINPSLGESITRVPDKGAIASWSPTGWGNVSGHDILNRGFFNALFQSGDGFLTLGMATQAGKIDLFSTGTNQDLMDTYLLFGDPATRIAFDFTAVNDDYLVEEDNILDISGGEVGKRGVLINDIHPQNLPISAVLVEDVTNGQLDFQSDGSFTYTPTPNYFGTDSFTYYASDGENISNIAIVEITVSAVDEKIFLPLIQNRDD
jgi:hypothetical protein